MGHSMGACGVAACRASQQSQQRGSSRLATGRHERVGACRQGIPAGHGPCVLAPPTGRKRSGS